MANSRGLKKNSLLPQTKTFSVEWMPRRSVYISYRSDLLVALAITSSTLVVDPESETKMGSRRRPGHHTNLTESPTTNTRGS
jgi:hypothetical protein